MVHGSPPAMVLFLLSTSAVRQWPPTTTVLHWFTTYCDVLCCLSLCRFNHKTADETVHFLTGDTDEDASEGASSESENSTPQRQNSPAKAEGCSNKEKEEAREEEPVEVGKGTGEVKEWEEGEGEEEDPDPEPAHPDDTLEMLLVQNVRAGCEVRLSTVNIYECND